MGNRSSSHYPTSSSPSPPTFPIYHPAPRLCNHGSRHEESDGPRRPGYRYFACLSRSMANKLTPVASGISSPVYTPPVRKLVTIRRISSISNTSERGWKEFRVDGWTVLKSSLQAKQFQVRDLLNLNWTRIAWMATSLDRYFVSSCPDHFLLSSLPLPSCMPPSFSAGLT